jgi:hypothetical protein
MRQVRQDEGGGDPLRGSQGDRGETFFLRWELVSRFVAEAVQMLVPEEVVREVVQKPVGERSGDGNRGGY